MSKRISVLFYVQHLLGTGHVNRVALIAREVAARGAKVVVAHGGFPVESLNWGETNVWKLPPIRSRDVNFTALVDEHDTEIDDKFKFCRRDALLACYQDTKPDVVVIEAYPFGRRQLRFELLPLLEQISIQSTPTTLMCSIRDVLQLKPEKRRQETLQILNNHFDAVLVHGDASFISLNSSFPESNRINCDVMYTGYVAKELSSHDSGAGKDEIIVAAGGGAAAGGLYQCAVKASQLCAHLEKSWRLLVGGGISDVEYQELRSQQSNSLLVERNRADYRNLLKNCALSISQAGYNSVLDVMQSGARALFIPFEGGGETEQVTRATRLSELGRARLIRESELSAQSLTNVVTESIESPPPENIVVDIGGINRSVEFILNSVKK